MRLYGSIHTGKTLALIALVLAVLWSVGCDSGDATPDGGTDSGSDGAQVEGALLQGIHYTEVDYNEGDTGSVLWLPLPLDYATQVPLYCEVIVDPEEAVDHLSYEVDSIGNTGVMVHLVEEGAFDPVVIHWNGVVMTREITDEERPSYYAADLAVDTWLDATQVVDAEYAPIAALGQQLADDSTDALDQVLSIIEWTSENITYPSNMDEWMEVAGLDATSTWDSKKGSCTSFADLGAALGRAGDLPSRVLANYYVGMEQQTHYIDEFYLGEDLGWRRVEPQTTAETLPEKYALTVRIVHPDDEGAEAFSSNSWAFPGVPWKTLTCALAGFDRLAPSWETDYFETCPSCDNSAEVLVDNLSADEDTFDDVFERAEALWQQDLQLLQADAHIPADRMTIRRAALDAASFEDVSDLIDQLEAL